MDIPTALVVVIVSVLALALLLFVYKFGIKEKSYEEAVAEQRLKANALLGAKPKPKEKKKKLKKSKEKLPLATDTEKSEDSENTESVTTEAAHPKLHVEFKEPALELPDRPPAPAPTKKQSKKEKVKPILVNKVPDNNVIENLVETPQTNRFEELHPKDDFELLASNTKHKEDLKHEAAKEKAEKHAKVKQNSVEQESNAKSAKKNVKQLSTEEAVVKEIVPEVTAVVNTAKVNDVQNSGKEKKKKKGEFNALQQLVGDKQAVNLPVVLNLVRKADLSRSEVQILIDLLLNKQQDAPSVEDWSEGKYDPVQKLKKQLAEKEKALLEEQEAYAGAQTKLREVRAEQVAEKSLLQQRIRGFEEALQNKQLELQALNNMLHGKGQKVQQLQAQLNDELMNMHKLREENAQLMLQRQQQECMIAQSQEADNVIAQLRNELQELSNRNNELSMNLHTLNERNMVDKEGDRNYIAQLQMQIASYQKDLEQTNELAKKQEETRINLERHLDMAQRQENEMQSEISKLKSACQQGVEEIRHIEHLKLQIHEEVSILRQQKEHSDSIIAKLQKDLEDLRLEKSKLQEAHLNGEKEQNKTREVELLNLHNELASLKSLLRQNEDKHASELTSAKNTVTALESEINEQKNKNNELRKKNWKVMEALNAAESRNKTAEPKPPVVNLDETVAKIQNDEFEQNKKFIVRIFPETEKLGRLSRNEWFTEVEKVIKDHLKANKAEEVAVKIVEPVNDMTTVAKLEAELLLYKTIINDTEGNLHQLQDHIEREEIHWRNILKAKDLEIDNLRRQFTQVDGLSGTR